MNPRVHAAAGWAGSLYAAPVAGILSDREACAKREQDQREVEFIALVNALGGMPRTAIIHGFPLQVNAEGVAWREKRMAEGQA